MTARSSSQGEFPDRRRFCTGLRFSRVRRLSYGVHTDERSRNRAGIIGILALSPTRRTRAPKRPPPDGGVGSQETQIVRPSSHATPAHACIFGGTQRVPRNMRKEQRRLDRRNGHHPPTPAPSFLRDVRTEPETDARVLRIRFDSLTTGGRGIRKQKGPGPREHKARGSRALQRATTADVEMGGIEPPSITVILRLLRA